MIFPTSISH